MKKGRKKEREVIETMANDGQRNENGGRNKRGKEERQQRKKGMKMEINGRNMRENGRK